MDKQEGLINQLAERLGLNPDQVYDIYVQKAFSYGLGQVIAGSIIFILAVTIGIWLLRKLVRDKQDGFDFMISLIFSFVMTFVGVFILSEGFDHMISPEYEAIETIAEDLLRLKLSEK